MSLTEDEIAKLVDRLVEERVSKRLAGVEQDLAALRGMVTQGGGNVPDAVWRAGGGGAWIL